MESQNTGKRFFRFSKLFTNPKQKTKMNITLNLNISPDTAPDDLRALLEVLAEYDGGDGPSTTRPPVREMGPNEKAYLEKSGQKRMRLTAEFAGVDRETAAMLKLAQLGVAPSASAPPPSAPSHDYSAPPDGEEWGE